MNYLKQLLACAFLILFITGCGGGADDPDSGVPNPIVDDDDGGDDGGDEEPGVLGPLTTGDIIVDYLVLDDDVPPTTAFAQFFRLNESGTPSVIELEEGDEIVVELGPEIRVLRQTTDGLGDPLYFGDFVIAGANQDADFRLIRANDIDAQFSGMLMPQDYSITGPAPGSVFQKDTLIDLTWDIDLNITTETHIFVANAACVDGSSAAYQRQISTDELNLLNFVPSNIFSELSFASNCTLTIGLIRSTTEGIAIDGELDGGRIQGLVQRLVDIEVTP